MSDLIADSRRLDAIHRLGTTLEGGMTAEQAMTAAQLSGWNVRKLPLTAHEITDDGVTEIALPKKFATVRDLPNGGIGYLGVVGDGYTIIQNEEHAGILDAITDESGSHFETAGQLSDGKRVFLSMKMPEAIEIGGRDSVDLYMIATNGHDGSRAFEVLVSPIRPVCRNTLDAAIRGARSRYRVRHTTNAKVNIQQAREALQMSWTYGDAFAKEAEALLSVKMTAPQFDTFAAELFKVSDAKTERQAAGRKERAAFAGSLFRNSETVKPVKGTAWGAYQAVTEYFDHFAPVRGARSESEAEIARAERTIDPFGEVRQIKELAFDVLSEVAHEVIGA